MTKSKWAVFCLLGALFLSPAAWADFILDEPEVTGTGSGMSEGTAVIQNGDDFTAPHYGLFDEQDITPGTAANSCQGSFVDARNGEASASTSADFTDTQDVNGDTVTTNVDGSTSATALRFSSRLDHHEAYSVLSAAGGEGTVAADDMTTETGFMSAFAETYVQSRGSLDNDAPAESIATVNGSADVSYQFAGNPDTETASVSNVDIEASADVQDENTLSSYARAGGWALSLMSWTDNDTQGQLFNAQVGISSETKSYHWILGDEEDLDAQAATSANAELDFTYRPIATPAFSFVGNAGGTAEAQSFIDSQNELGTISADAGKHAIARAGTSTDYPALSVAWLSANVRVNSDDDFSENGTDDDFTGYGRATAVNPAVLGDGPVDPDPSMTATTQYGTFAAAIGSSSQSNAQLEAAVSFDKLETDADDQGQDDEAFATAFGFAIATQDQASYTNLGPNELFSLDSESAFVGFGAITGGDEDQGADPDSPFSATADAYNLYGTASSPLYSGLVNNGDASSSIIEDEDGVYHRANSASADLVSGTDYPVAVAHNQLGGAVEFSNTPWWWGFGDRTLPGTGGDYDHLSGAFIGAGGN